jgi:membrane-associated HD superfamily phosphohydrolase
MIFYTTNADLFGYLIAAAAIFLFCLIGILVFFVSKKYSRKEFYSRAFMTFFLILIPFLPIHRYSCFDCPWATGPLLSAILFLFYFTAVVIVFIIFCFIFEIKARRHKINELSSSPKPN